MFSRHSERRRDSVSSREMERLFSLFCGELALKRICEDSNFSRALTRMFFTASETAFFKFAKFSKAKLNSLEMYSAAPLGVSARRSDAKSHKEKSTSCPTAEIVGILHAATALQQFPR